MATVYGSMGQYASRCGNSTVGTSFAAICLIADTVIVAVSVFIFQVLGQML